MQNYWEFTQKNVFSELFSLLGRMTQDNLTHQIEYLKVENEILRKRVGRSIRPTPGERRKLVKFGAPLGKNLRGIISIVTYQTFLFWARNYKRNKNPDKIRKRGRPKSLEEIRILIIKLVKENTWGYVRILGELKQAGD